MMKMIGRNELISAIVDKQYSLLNEPRKVEILCNWRSCDESDLILPVGGVDGDQVMVEDLHEYLRDELYGVRNQYLIELADETGAYAASEVYGVPETLHSCPCCHYLTLRDRGQQSICKVCFWQDEGDPLDAGRSPANHGLTLQEARGAFREFGAVDKKFSRFLYPDRLRMYDVNSKNSADEE